MAQFSIADLERLATIGKGSGHVTSHDHSDHETFNLHRNVRGEIYAFALASGRAVSRGEIAKALKLKKTGWLHSHIEALVGAGKLTRREGLWTNGVLMYWYTVERG